MPRQSGDADRVTQRRVEVSRLYCQGWPQHKIAQRFGVIQQQISKDLAAIRKEWQRVMVEEFDRLRAEQLAEVDALEAEAWRGWRRSQRDAQKHTAGTTATGSVNTTVTEGQAGDPGFLKVIDSCIDRRCKIIGAYAPTKVANTNPDGTPAPPLVIMMPDNRRLPEVTSHRANGIGPHP